MIPRQGQQGRPHTPRPAGRHSGASSAARRLAGGAPQLEDRAPGRVANSGWRRQAGPGPEPSQKLAVAAQRHMHRRGQQHLEAKGKDLRAVDLAP
eukprot:7255731-Pyramimonas_sp.AAC.1